MYVCNVNRVSNSCKTGLKGYDFKEDLMYLGLFFIKNLCKRVCFFEILCTEGSLAKFCDFLQFFVFKSSNSCTCLGAKLLHNYLFRVEKRKKNTCLGCQIPLLYLFRDTNFSQGNICLGYFLRVHGRA